MTRLKLICFFSIILFYAPNCRVYGQDSLAIKQEIKIDSSHVDPVIFSDNAIEDYRRTDDFKYIEYKAPDNWYTRFKQWLSDIWASIIDWILDGDQAQGFLALLIKALPYLILIAVLTFIIWLFIKIDTGGTPLLARSGSNVILSSEQEILEREDIRELIQQAVAANNYRLAVRYYYLLALQQLKDKDVIDWQVQKTNHDYVYEIKNNDVRQQFVKVTRIYDFIWYGSFVVDTAAFAKAEKEFKKLQDLV